MIYSWWVLLLFMLIWFLAVSKLFAKTCILLEATKLAQGHLMVNQTTPSLKCKRHRYMYTIVKVDGATPKRWLRIRGHDKPIHGICAIYFPGGIYILKYQAVNISFSALFLMKTDLPFRPPATELTHWGWLQGLWGCQSGRLHQGAERQNLAKFRYRGGWILRDLRIHSGNLT